MLEKTYFKETGCSFMRNIFCIEAREGSIIDEMENDYWMFCVLDVRLKLGKMMNNQLHKFVESDVINTSSTEQLLFQGELCRHHYFTKSGAAQDWKWFCFINFVITWGALAVIMHSRWKRKWKDWKVLRQCFFLSKMGEWIDEFVA